MNWINSENSKYLLEANAPIWFYTAWKEIIIYYTYNTCN